MDKRKISVAYSSVLIGLSVFVLTNENLARGGATSSLDAMTLPRLIAVAIILFSGKIAISSMIDIHKGKATENTHNFDMRGFYSIVAYFLILIGYWWFMPVLGFILATSVAILLISVLLKARNWPIVIATSIVVPVVLFYVSKDFLRVFLPTMT